MQRSVGNTALVNVVTGLKSGQISIMFAKGRKGVDPSSVAGEIVESCVEMNAVARKDIGRKMLDTLPGLLSPQLRKGDEKKAAEFLDIVGIGKKIKRISIPDLRWLLQAFNQAPSDSPQFFHRIKIVRKGRRPWRFSQGLLLGA